MGEGTSHMKILLIYPNIVETPKDISLGLAIISSILKKHNHKVKLLDTTFHNPHTTDIEQLIKDFDPELVAVTAATNDLHNAIRICKKIKKIKLIPIVCGGYHATISPEDILKQDCFDVAAIGESEQSLIQFINTLEKQEYNYNIPNLWIKKDKEIIKNKIGQLTQDLDSIPFADREIFNYQEYIDSNRGLATFISSKGCPFQCSYCINKVLMQKYKGQGKYLRFRSIDNLLKEIKQVTNNYKVKEIEFYDDTFTLDKKRVKEFAEKYPKEINIPFYINARVNAVTRENFRLLKQAGCIRVSIGIEAGDPFIRNTILKRNQTNEQIINTFKWAKEEGLKTYAFNMIGIPYEDEKSVKKTIELNRKIQPDYAGASIFNAFKGTDLYDLCKKNNWLKEKYSKSYFQSSNVKHPHFTIKKLKKIRDSFGFQIYKKTSRKRAYIDLLDKKLTKLPLYTKIRSKLIEKGIKKIIEK
jgi:anaerobic magnesium-protoporphyrin IX monomethyl ester cyclase